MENQGSISLQEFSKWLCENNIRLKISYNKSDNAFYATACHNDHAITSSSSSLEKAIESLRVATKEHLKICVS